MAVVTWFGVFAIVCVGCGVQTLGGPKHSMNASQKNESDDTRSNHHGQKKDVKEHHVEVKHNDDDDDELLYQLPPPQTAAAVRDVNTSGDGDSDDDVPLWTGVIE